MTPESVGVAGSKLVLGKHSGRNALNYRLKQLGFEFDKEELLEVYDAFTRLADAKKNLLDEDLIAIANKIVSSDDSKVEKEVVESS